MPQRPQILWVVDKPGWAFHRLACNVSKRTTDKWRHHIAPVDLIQGATADVAVVLWWRSHPAVLDRVNAKSIILCLFDHVSWCKHPIDIMDFERALGGSDVLVVGNEMLAEQIRTADLCNQPTFICEDGVDCELFQPRPFPAEFTAGWCGDSSCGNGRIKGLDGIIEACDMAGVPLKTLDKTTGNIRNHDDMPDWYGDISCYICASTAEGTPNPCLEAMACGRPVITTKVGVMPRVVSQMHNGVLVERTAGSIAQALREVEAAGVERMGHAARMAAETFDWQHKIPAWRCALDAACERIEVKRRPYPPRKVKPGMKPRILCVSDTEGWAFDRNERDMARYLSDRFDFEFWSINNKTQPPAMGGFHGIFLPYHRWFLDHYWGALPRLGSLRAQHIDLDAPDTVPDQDAAWFDRCTKWHVVNRRAEMFLGTRFPNMVYLTNPIDIARFPSPTHVTGAVVAAWAGNTSHRTKEMVDTKGLTTVIQPACKLSGVDLNIAEYNTCRVPSDEMPDWWRRSNVCCCASLTEGASNSVMEAMAAGLAVVATDCGNHREMVDSEVKHFGNAGIMLVERTPEAFAEALRRLTPARVAEMGEINRIEIAARWSWEVWADRYADFLGSVCAN